MGVARCIKPGPAVLLQRPGIAILPQQRNQLLVRVDVAQQLPRSASKAAIIQALALLLAPRCRDAADGCSLPGPAQRRRQGDRRQRTASRTFWLDGSTPNATRAPPSITVSPSTRTLNSP